MKLFYFILFLSFLIPLESQSQLNTSKLPVKPPLLINGAGASFPYILYSKWFSEYRKINPTVMINYRSIGSGGGIRQFLTRTLDFGATDVPMLKSQQKKSKKKILHIPMALGAVVISYNLKSVKKTIRLTAPVLLDIYLGKITKWNDPKISKINQGIVFPKKNIVPIYRSDGSGTTAIFTEYLAHFTSQSLQTIGKGKSVNWQTGIGGKGNEGVMGMIQKIEGSIGYVAMSYAMNRTWPMAEIKNQSGEFIKPLARTVKMAAEQTFKKTQDLFKTLVVAPGKTSYPLSAYTYLLIYQEMFSVKGEALVQFLNWSMVKGQKFCEKLHFVSLPPSVIKLSKHKIQLIKVKGNDKKI